MTPLEFVGDALTVLAGALGGLGLLVAAFGGE